MLAAGALPLIIGGDHAIPIPVLRAFDRHGPITLVKIDAHIDWRDEVIGVRHGLSSPIRRASEMPHIGRIFQIGLRATGSARLEEVEAARTDLRTALADKSRRIVGVTDYRPSDPPPDESAPVDAASPRSPLAPIRLEDLVE